MVGNVEVLGDSKIAEVTRNGEGLIIRLEAKPVSDKPICFRIEIS